jgi:hypothetical protein
MRYFALLLPVALLLAGCDLFKVRESEPPTKPPLWNNYSTSWELCLQNLGYCYTDSRNAVKYSGLFTSDFSFHFAAQDVNDYGISPSWARANEQDMLLNLHSLSDSIQLSLENLSGQSDDIGPSEAKIYRKYTLILFKPGKLTTEEYSGNLELQFRQSGGYWYIAKWYDYRAYSQPTWGKMKYDYSQ